MKPTLQPWYYFKLQVLCISNFISASSYFTFQNRAPWNLGDILLRDIFKDRVIIFIYPPNILSIPMFLCQKGIPTQYTNADKSKALEIPTLATYLEYKMQKRGTLHFSPHCLCKFVGIFREQFFWKNVKFTSKRND